MSQTYLLLKRGLYWRPNSAGYTGLKREAGRYDYFSAVERCRDEDDFDGVTMVQEHLAPDYAPSCCSSVKFADMERRIRALENGRKP